MLDALFKSRKKELGIGQQEIADELNISQGAVGHYLGGRNPLNLKAATAFAKILQVNISSFSKRLAKQQEDVLSIVDSSDDYLILSDKIPVISWSDFPNWCESPESFHPSAAEQWFFAPIQCSKNSVFLQVIGDSMWPAYAEGDYILIDPKVEPQHGNDVVVKTPDGKYPLKRLQITPEGKYLLAVNVDHPNRKIEVPEDSLICGVVVVAIKLRVSYSPA